MCPQCHPLNLVQRIQWKSEFIIRSGHNLLIPHAFTQSNSVWVRAATPSSPKDLTLEMLTFQGKLRKQHVAPSFLSAGQSQGRSGAWGTPLVPRNKAITRNVHSVVKLFFSDFRVRIGNSSSLPCPPEELAPAGRFGIKPGNLQTVGINSETFFFFPSS